MNYSPYLILYRLQAPGTVSDTTRSQVELLEHVVCVADWKSSLLCYVHDFVQVLGNFLNLKSSSKNWDGNKCPLHRDVSFRKHKGYEVPDQSEILSDC